MPLSTEAFPNKPLDGAELAQVIRNHVEKMLEGDCMFSPTLAYGRCAFTVTLTVHVGDLINPRVEARTFVRPDGAVEGNAPLKNPPEDARFVSKERRKRIDNPNLERVHNGLPFRSQRRTQPDSGAPYGGVENIEVHVEPGGDYPEPEPPVDNDVTEREAEKLGVRYSVRDQEDLDAISTEGD